MSKITLNHPVLGTLTGISRGPVLQFLGVRYATLAHRFSAAALSSNPPPDCTSYSPVPIQPRNRISAEWETIGQKLSTPLEAIERLERQSETECLTLNISKPAAAEAVPTNKGLPILVFIHGGGFSQGASAWPQYDLAHIVSQSIDIQKPIIAISINYRTNIPGFLTIPSHPTNRGLNDQKTAFRWLHKHIGSFGGDPERITALGQSAGGVSVSLHLRDPTTPLFSRAVLMSGDATSIQPAPREVHQNIFEKVCEGLGLGGKSEQEKIDALDTINSAEMLAKAPNISFLPLLDGDMFKSPITLDDVAQKDEQNRPAKKTPGWLEALMVGDVKDDGYIMASAVQPRKQGIGKAFSDYLESAVGSPHAKEILTAYEISPSTLDDTAVDRVLLLLNDVAFYVPAVLTARGWPDDKPVYVYHFNCLNTWAGAALHGKSNHILDIAYLFGNDGETLDKSERVVAQAFAKSMIIFVNGEEPWSKFEYLKESIMVYGKDGAVVKGKNEEERRGRRKEIWRLVDKVGAGKLHEAVMGFLG